MGCQKCIPASEKPRGRLGGVLSFVKELWGARDLRGPDSQEVIESISKMLLCLEEMGG